MNPTGLEAQALKLYHIIAQMIGRYGSGEIEKYRKYTYQNTEIMVAGSHRLHHTRTMNPASLQAQLRPQSFDILYIKTAIQKHRNTKEHEYRNTEIPKCRNAEVHNTEVHKYIYT